MIDGEQLVNDLLRDLEAHGVVAIHRLIETNPLAFLQMCAALVCDIHEVEGDEEEGKRQLGR